MITFSDFFLAFFRSLEDLVERSLELRGFRSPFEPEEEEPEEPQIPTANDTYGMSLSLFWLFVPSYSHSHSLGAFNLPEEGYFQFKSKLNLSSSHPQLPQTSSSSPRISPSSTLGNGPSTYEAMPAPQLQKLRTQTFPLAVSTPPGGRRGSGE